MVKRKVLSALTLGLIMVACPGLSGGAEEVPASGDPNGFEAIAISSDGSWTPANRAGIRPREPVRFNSVTAECPSERSLDAVTDTSNLPPQPSVADPVDLRMTKSGSAPDYQLNLAWSGSSGPFTVIKSTVPSFQSNILTLATELAGAVFVQASTPTQSLECFEVTDGTTVSLGAQTLGYTPNPAPTIPALSANGLWWGDPITLTGNYLDPIAKGNLVNFWDRPVRAGIANPSSGNFATSADFTIPCDSRSTYVTIEAKGRSSPVSGAPFLELYAKGITISDMTSLSWAPCPSASPAKGNIFIAGGGEIKEVDIFRKDPPAPAVHASGLTKPYLSRPTLDGRILFVDGVSGVAEIQQVDVCSGAVSHYANTTDGSFTRAILPVGIAADPDGNYCYVADSNLGKVVQIRANNLSNIADTYGGWDYDFPDPCGIDVNVGHQIWVGSADKWVAMISGPTTTTYQYSTAPKVPNCIQIDRDTSTAAFTRHTYSNELFCEAYNLNPIEEPAETPPRYLGGEVWGLPSGKLKLTPHWWYFVSHHFPQHVVLNNSGQGVSYPSPYQSLDRVVRMDVGGWNGVKLRLRVIDPPDFSAYVSDGGCLQGGCSPAPPYEGNDNFGNSDYGLTLNSNGSGATPTLTTAPPSGYTLAFYLKVPARYAGDNFQVEVTKCDAAGTVLPERIPGLSAVYTSWKRVFVERDRMFRRGGLIFAPNASQMTIPAGSTSLQIYKGPAEVQVDNLFAGDKIAMFDAGRPFEGLHDEAYVGSIDRTSNPDYAIITLTAVDLITPSPTLYAYTASPMAGDHYPDFSQGQSAGVGVISGCDAASNQINASNSCFYDADMRDIEEPFTDGYVEFVGRPSGMGAVPYVDENIPFYDLGTDTGPEATNRLFFESIWSKHGLNWLTPNYIYFLGCKGRSYIPPGSLTAGISVAPNHYSYIYVNSVDTWGQEQSPPFTQDQTTMAIQYDTDHEAGHQFKTNICTTTPPCPGSTPYHDDRSWWKYSATGCPAPNQCLEEYDLPNPPTGVNRFCKEDLLLGDPNCSGSPRPGAVRTYNDPLP